MAMVGLAGHANEIQYQNTGIPHNHIPTPHNIIMLGQAETLTVCTTGPARIGTDTDSAYLYHIILGWLASSGLQARRSFSAGSNY